MLEVSIAVNALATEIKTLDSEGNLGGSIFSPAGIELIEAFVESVKNQRGVLASRFSCGQVVLQIGGYKENVVMLVRGRNISDGAPIGIEVTSHEIQAAIFDVMQQIVANIERGLRFPLENSPLKNDQILLKGEFKHLHGLAEALTEAIGILVMVEP